MYGRDRRAGDGTRMLRKREKAGKRKRGMDRVEVREEGRHEESAEEVINVDEDVCRGEDKGTVKL